MATLHPTRRIQALAPLYTERFACIGQACEDTCCAGWRVTIDKKTFNAYRKSTNPHLVDRLGNNIKRLRSHSSDEKYAQMDLDNKTGACLMIEDQLCSIQKELGEDKLSNTCFSYPRVSSEFGGIHQQALLLSCPEAARLALLADDAMSFIQLEITVRPEIIEKQKPVRGLSIDQMNEIRFFCIQLLKKPELLLWQKLTFLGLFCETLTEALRNGGQSRVSRIIESVEALISNKEFSELFENMQPQYEVQAMTFSLLWKTKINGICSLVDKAVYNSVVKGIGFDFETGQIEESRLIDQYKKGVLQLPKALKDTPFFLENYLLNEMFRDNFPFGQNSPYDQYLELITRFGIVRFMLASQCATETELPSIKVLTQTVQSFCKRYQHDGQFAVDVQNCFKNSGWNDLQKIVKFLKT